MKLDVLGNWAGSPGPGSACSGYLVSEGATQLLMDCGQGVVPILQEEQDMTGVTAIFISHMHADHSLDLLTFAYRLLRFTWRGRDLKEVKQVPLFLPPGGGSVLEHLVAAYGRPEGSRLSNPFEAAFAVKEIKPEVPLKLGTLTVTPFEVRHTVAAVGYRIDGPSGSFAYSGDTGPCPNLARLAHGVDVFLCEAMSSETDPLRTNASGHLTAGQAGLAAAEAGAKRLVLTHFPRQDIAWLDSLRIGAESTFPKGVSLAFCSASVAWARS